MTTPPIGSAEESGMKLSVSRVARQRKLLTPNWGIFDVSSSSLPPRKGQNQERPLSVLVETISSARLPQATSRIAAAASRSVRIALSLSCRWVAAQHDPDYPGPPRASSPPVDRLILALLHACNVQACAWPYLPLRCSAAVGQSPGL